MCYHQRKLMPEWKNNRNVRKSQLVQTLREKLAIESLILLMPMATKFDQRKKINIRNQKNNLAKNFLLTNFNLIANNHHREINK